MYSRDVETYMGYCDRKGLHKGPCIVTIKPYECLECIWKQSE